MGYDLGFLLVAELAAAFGDGAAEGVKGIEEVSDKVSDVATQTGGLSKKVVGLEEKLSTMANVLLELQVCVVELCMTWQQ